MRGVELVMVVALTLRSRLQTCSSKRTLRVELTLMHIKKLFITLILILIPSTVSSTQASILDALRAGIPSSIVASKIDQLIQDAPNCSTVHFLRSILQNYPSNKAIIYRIARRFHQL
ncbi:hypothetical protein PN36_18120 [Candidatus Thiomargarita nelsonii]|uniref:Uncharacterized protein n=1 Tax=Candidatus Thiomargarita nelsonii TaxID=1003181 RepID=A0A0A6P5G4_9GAMM|nr:hypothetical protein PN36_18120 [Candidatus Thiomargarita nelsonii]